MESNYCGQLLPYSRKLSREKTFTNFAVLWRFAKVFFAKFGGVVSFGKAEVSNLRRFSPWKSYFSPIRESFLPWKFSAIRYRLRGILLPLLFEVCTGAGPVDALEVQSSNSNTKVSRVQVHSQSEGTTRSFGVRLTSQSMHFRSQEYQNTVEPLYNGHPWDPKFCPL